MAEAPSRNGQQALDKNFLEKRLTDEEIEDVVDKFS